MFGVYQYCTFSSAPGQDVPQMQLYRSIAEELDDVAQRDFLATKHELEEDSKAKFLPLLPLMAQIASLKEDVTNQIASIEREISQPETKDSNPQKELDRVTIMAQEAVTEVITSSKILLEKHGQDFDLSIDDITEFKLRFQDLGSVFSTTAKANVLHTTRSIDEKLLSLKMNVNLLSLQVQSRLRIIHGSKMIMCFLPPLLPFLDSYDLVAKQGQQHRLDFGVSDYTSTVDPQNYRLVVGNDTIPFNSYGYSSVNVPTNKRGKQKIETKLIVTNPLTGTQRVNKTYFHYYVE